MHRGGLGKLGNFKKKPPFMNAVKKKGYFKKQVELHEPARDHREKEALIFPDRIKDNTKTWKYQGHKKDVIMTMPGREIDTFDEEKVKFFQKPARLDGATKTTVTKRNPDGTISKELKEVKWHATKFK